MNQFELLACLPRLRSKCPCSQAAPRARKCRLRSNSSGTFGLSFLINLRGRTAANSRCHGTNPKGVAIFDAGGQFIITVMRSDRGKYAIDFPTRGTAEENQATAQGTITYFGTYSVSEADRTIDIHLRLVRSRIGTVPIRNGAFAITGDRLTLTARALQTEGERRRRLEANLDSPSDKAFHRAPLSNCLVLNFARSMVIAFGYAAGRTSLDRSNRR